MTQMLLAIAPIFVLIVLGHLLRRGGIPSLEFWNLNDKLAYWVLFPALLFYKIATMEISGELLGGYAVVVYTSFGAVVIYALLAGRWFGLAPPARTSVLQGSVRHNTFIALSVAERVFGGEGLAMAALITALLIPITNVSVVTLMLAILHGAEKRGVLQAIFRDLVRNPLLIAILLGLAFNLSNIGEVPVLYDVTKILGAAALPIMLMCVGANIRIREMAAAAAPIWLSIAGKMVLFPLLIGSLAIAIGLDPLAILIGLIFGAVPCAASAYTLARQMGGDAPLMAAIVAIQTALSFITLPATLLLAQHWIVV